MTRRVVLAACTALLIGATPASAAAPLALDQPLGIDVAPNGSLLVVEFGFRRLVRVVPSTGRITQIATFAKPWGGFAWLGTKLITPSLIIAYIWIWAGFAMVVIAAGLSAMPRDVLEAARTDGASELQVFRRVTVPLLAPVLSVVFVTMIINVLKVFDIVFALAPEHL